MDLLALKWTISQNCFEKTLKKINFGEFLLKSYRKISLTTIKSTKQQAKPTKNSNLLTFCRKTGLKRSDLMKKSYRRASMELSYFRAMDSKKGGLQYDNYCQSS